jgi:uncharacterized protein YjhX (UPF0386 family)
MDFEIGQKVEWKIGTFICRGIYFDKIDDKLSSVKCYERDGEKFICTVEVITELLKAIS